MEITNLYKELQTFIYRHVTIKQGHDGNSKPSRTFIKRQFPSILKIEIQVIWRVPTNSDIQNSD